MLRAMSHRSHHQHAPPPSHHHQVVASSPIRKGRWSPSEDHRLMESIRQHGANKWKKVAQDVRTRSGDQCWKRWNDSLDPSLNHSQWTPAEDEMLETSVANMGRCWSKIANENLNGRSGLACKNRMDHLERRKRRTQTYCQQQQQHYQYQFRNQQASALVAADVAGFTGRKSFLVPASANTSIPMSFSDNPAPMHHRTPFSLLSSSGFKRDLSSAVYSNASTFAGTEGSVTATNTNKWHQQFLSNDNGHESSPLTWHDGHRAVLYGNDHLQGTARESSHYGSARRTSTLENRAASHWPTNLYGSSNTPNTAALSSSPNVNLVTAADSTQILDDNLTHEAQSFTTTGAAQAQSAYNHGALPHGYLSITGEAASDFQSGTAPSNRYTSATCVLGSASAQTNTSVSAANSVLGGVTQNGTMLHQGLGNVASASAHYAPSFYEAAGFRNTSMLPTNSSASAPSPMHHNAATLVDRPRDDSSLHVNAAWYGASAAEGSLLRSDDDHQHQQVQQSQQHYTYAHSNGALQSTSDSIPRSACEQLHTRLAICQPLQASSLVEHEMPLATSVPIAATHTETLTDNVLQSATIYAAPQTSSEGEQGESATDNSADMTQATSVLSTDQVTQPALGVTKNMDVLLKADAQHSLSTHDRHSADQTLESQQQPEERLLRLDHMIHARRSEYMISGSVRQQTHLWPGAQSTEISSAARPAVRTSLHTGRTGVYGYAQALSARERAEVVAKLEHEAHASPQNGFSSPTTTSSLDHGDSHKTRCGQGAFAHRAIVDRMRIRPENARLDGQGTGGVVEARQTRLSLADVEVDETSLSTHGAHCDQNDSLEVMPNATLAPAPATSLEEQNLAMLRSSSRASL